MKKIVLFQFTFFLLLAGCSQQKNKISGKTIDRTRLDSIIKMSDSSYTKSYVRTDFVTALYYVNKKDSSVCQVMKDSADSIRQIIIAKNNIRTFFGQYYASGVLQADLPLDEFGQHHGNATFFYENGTVQSSGNFNHGLKAGEWKVFDENGKLTATDRFDKDGQQIPEQHP